MTPRRVSAPYDWAALLRLIRLSFAYMEGRVDPPSSMTRLAPETIAAQARNHEIWVIEDQGAPVACMFLTMKPDRMYLGKLAVAPTHRGKGLARRLIGQAEHRARIQGLPLLELQTRVELLENHATFTAMGFAQTGASAHDGFDHPTSLTFSKPV